jgi:hypothetical protein
VMPIDGWIDKEVDGWMDISLSIGFTQPL